MLISESILSTRFNRLRMDFAKAASEVAIGVFTPVESMQLEQSLFFFEPPGRRQSCGNARPDTTPVCAAMRSDYR